MYVCVYVKSSENILVKARSLVKDLEKFRLIDNNCMHCAFYIQSESLLLSTFFHA